MPHQSIQVVSDKSAVVDNVSLEDDEEEEKSQHHVTKVTEDVVKCAVEGRVGQMNAPNCESDTCSPTHLRAPSGWAHRKL